MVGMRWGKVFDALPQGLSRSETLFFDAVDLLIPAALLQYSRMQQAALEYAILHSRQEQHSETIRDQISDLQAIIMADAGSFVATVQRLRRAVSRLRGDPEIRTAKGAFEAAVRPYEQGRHHLEHLDTSIPKIASGPGPALGTIGWWYVEAEPSKAVYAIILAPGHLAPGFVAGMRVPGSYRPPVDHLWTTIAGADYYLTGAADAVVALAERLRQWSTQWASERPASSRPFEEPSPSDVDGPSMGSP